MIKGSDDAVAEVVDIVSAGEEVTTDALLVSALVVDMAGTLSLLKLLVVVVMLLMPPFPRLEPWLSGYPSLLHPGGTG